MFYRCVPCWRVCAPQIHPYLNNDELLEWCKDKHIHVTAYAPLGNVNPDFASALEDPVISEIAERAGKSPAQVGKPTSPLVSIEPSVAFLR